MTVLSGNHELYRDWAGFAFRATGGSSIEPRTKRGDGRVAFVIAARDAAIQGEGRASPRALPAEAPAVLDARVEPGRDKRDGRRRDADGGRGCVADRAGAYGTRYGGTGDNCADAGRVIAVSPRAHSSVFGMLSKNLTIQFLR